MNQESPSSTFSAVWQKLRPLIEAPASAALLVDFDGTISAIVERAEDAKPIPGAFEVLEKLATHLGEVAIVSGRPASFLLSHRPDAQSPPGLQAGQGAEPLRHLRLIGLYGMQTVDGSRVVTDQRVDTWSSVVRQAVTYLSEHAPVGLSLEDKELSVALHFRAHPELAGQALELAVRCSERTGLKLEPGRMVYELRPPIPMDKGAVVRRLAAKFAIVCYIGDDSADIAAFDEMDRLATEGAVAIKIVVGGEECPAALRDAADVVIPGPEELVSLLADAADLLHRRAMPDSPESS